MRHIQNLRGAILPTIIAAALMALLVACTTASPVPAATEQPASDQATLIVQFDDNRTVVRKVNFTAPSPGWLS